MSESRIGFRIGIENKGKVDAAVEKKMLALVEGLQAVVLRGGLRIRANVVSALDSGSRGIRSRTGRFSRAIRVVSEKFPMGARATVGTSAVVPYPPIHEFGGTTAPHVILPRRKAALRWTGGVTRLGQLVALAVGGTTRKQAFRARAKVYEGGDVHFARRVNHPGSRIPARPQFRPAFQEERPEIEVDLNRTVAGILRA